MDELSGCGNVLHLLILHTETYTELDILTRATAERKEDPQTVELYVVLP